MKLVIIALMLLNNAFAREILLTENNTVSLLGPVTSVSVGEVMYELSTISQKGNPEDPIFLVLNTPGGSVMAGLSLVEYMNTLRRPVTVIANFAASMGFHILQHSNQRLVTPFATIMSHRANGGFKGDIPHQVSNRLNHIINLVNKMDDHVISRTKGKYNRRSYMNLIRDEYYSVGSDAIKDGFADEVVTLKCDETLNQYVTKTFTVVVFTVSVKLSKCPLVTLPVAETQEGTSKLHEYFTNIRSMEF
jgi:ATP-dependent Clp protease protease subunit